MKSFNSRILSALVPAAIGLTTTLTVATAHAQSDYPNKTVTIVIPTAGTGIENDVRFFIQSIETTNPGVHFIMEPRPGAASTIGSAYVAKAKPDGYTLLAPNTALTIASAVYPDLPYDVTKDFTPITLLMQKAYLLLVNANTPFKSVKEYLDFARANPNKLNFSTSGAGSSTHLPGAMLHYVTKTEVTFVHYKRSADRVLDLVTGRVDAAVGTYATMLPNIKSGKVRPLAVTTSKRIASAPELPTIAEAGVPGFEYSSWTGLLGPAKMPPAIVDKLNRIWAASLKDPVVIKKLEADGTLPVGSSPAEFQKFIVADAARWKSLINDTGIKVQEE